MLFIGTRNVRSGTAISDMYTFTNKVKFFPFVWLLHSRKIHYTPSIYVRLRKKGLGHFIQRPHLCEFLEGHLKVIQTQDVCVAG